MNKISDRRKFSVETVRKYVLVGVCGILAVSSVLITVETATSGVEVSKLQREEINLADKKRYLEDSLVKTMSISQLETKSNEMGYVKPVTLVYVTPSEVVAKLP